MRWHIALRLAGSLLLVAAAIVISLQVHVGGSGLSGRSCGSSLDVITDRAGWEVWYAEDTVDEPSGSNPRLLRTVLCPGAVNARSVTAGVLGAVGLAALIAAAALQRARPSVAAAVDRPLAVRLRRLGALVTLAAATLVVAGLLALGVLLADSDAPLFIFVRRPLVAAIGIVVLAPALALVVGGRALTILAHALQDRDTRDEVE